MSTTLATCAQPNLEASRPSRKNLSTSLAAKERIATSAIYLESVYRVKGESARDEKSASGPPRTFREAMIVAIFDSTSIVRVSRRDTGDRLGVEGDAVTEMLERALAQLSRLPPAKQDEVAAWLLAEFEDEGRWAAALEDSQGTLEALADEALAEHRGGLTEPLD
ncbi:MAG: hypothetical protein ACYDBY_17710 [Thermoanaerobaculia bacterium]